LGLPCQIFEVDLKIRAHHDLGQPTALCYVGFLTIQDYVNIICACMLGYMIYLFWL